MEKRTNVFLSIILPAYNEAKNLLLLIPVLISYAEKYEDYEIIVIDDGSTDDSLNILKSMNASNPKIHYLSLSRNFGHQNALRAGLDHAQGNCILTMDADFQHPPEIIPEMVEIWQNGYDIVITKRETDPKLPIFKRISSKVYYQLLNRISDVEIESGTADFRLLDRSVVDVMKSMHEPNIFLRGMVNWIGYRKYTIPYKPAQRAYGSTKYGFQKMTRLALQGIMSFSPRPLRIAVYMGLFVSFFAMLYAFYALYVHFFTDQTVPGWTSVIISVLFCGGVQMLLLGIIGEYLGKLFMDSKRRPDYLIREQSSHHASIGS